MEVFKKVIEFVMDILETITFVGSIFIVIYLFVFQPHQVKGASMDPTFHDGQYIITSKIAYRLDKPKLGDVVVFKSTQDIDYEFIKRIIAVPGDRVKIKDGVVFVNGNPLTEYYTQSPTNPFSNGFIREDEEISIPQGAYFVLGDNRIRSSDSRDWGFVPYNAIVGKVIFRYYPFDKIGPIKNPFTSLIQYSNHKQLVNSDSIKDYSLYQNHLFY